MEKVKNKILICMIIIASLIVSVLGLYKIYAASSEAEKLIVPILDDKGNKISEKIIENDNDLAKWATNSTQDNGGQGNKSFVNANLKKFINSYISLYSAKRDDKKDATIVFPGAACMYHSQSGTEGGKYKIVNIIDFVGTKATVYSSPSDDGKNVKNATMNGALLYAMNQAAKGVPDPTVGTHSAWKSAFKRLFFEHNELLKLLDPSFKSNDSNNDSTDPTINLYMAQAKGNGKNMGDPTEKPKKTNTEPSKNTSGYLGPFKVSTFGGYKPNKLTFTLSGSGSLLGSEVELKKVSTKKDGKYTEIDVKDIKETEAFYIKCEDKITSDWTLKLHFESTGYKGRIVLIREKVNEGQNLSIYGAPTCSTFTETLKWTGKPPTGKGCLEIIKVDENDEEKRLQGAVFKVYNEDKSFVKADLKTDEDGTILLKDLEPGKYTIEEIQPPEGYGLSKYPKHVVTVYESNDEDNPVSIRFKNPVDRKEGVLIIRKVDEEGKVISDGVEFLVEGPGGYKKTVSLKGGYGYVDGKRTGAGFISISKLSFGPYKITETKAPEGYAIDPVPKEVDLREGEKIEPVEVYVVNKKEEPNKGKLRIIKKDTATLEALVGAKFRVQAFPKSYPVPGSDPIIRYEYDTGDIEVVNKEGILLVNLEPGNYIITETQAPPGYEISAPNTKTVHIEENRDGEPTVEQVYEFYDQKIISAPPHDEYGKLVVYKYDGETKQPIPGVTFEVWERKVTNEMVLGWGDSKTTDTGYYNTNKTITTGSDGYCSYEVKLHYNTDPNPNYYKSEDYYYKLVEKSCSGPYDINDQIYHYGVIDSNIDKERLVVSTEELGSFYKSSPQKTVKIENKLYGNIELYKIDNDDYDGEKEVPLKDAKFIFYYIDESGDKQYIKDYKEKKNQKVEEDVLGPSEVTFTTDEKQAKEFITGEDGYIRLKKLPAHRKYYAKETGLVNPEDEDFYRLYSLFNEDVEFDLENLDATATSKQKVANQQAYTKLSGRVWDDTHEEGKLTVRNNLYDSGENLIKGIEVRLVYSGTDTTVRQEAREGEEGAEFITYTDENGYYEFKKVPKAELNKYDVKFKYNGLRYEKVTPITSPAITNGSKADDIDRDAFNERYAIIEKGVSKTQDNTDTNKLSYTRGEHTSTLVKNLGYTAEPTDYEGRVDPIGDSEGTKIYADTSIIHLADHLLEYSDSKFKEVRHINLGIYEKEQPDISIMNDLQNIRTEINEKEHTYNYEQRFKNMGLAGGDGHDVGVKFGNKYGKMKYTRAIYKSDYTNVSLGAKELEVYVTYKIQMKNTSTSLQTKVNRLVDYYDLNYEQQPQVGTKIDAVTGKITEEIKADKIKTEKVSGNQKLTISLEDLPKIPAQQVQDIYVQFKLTRETVKKLEEEAEKIKDGEPGDNLTNNLVEIDSYSVFDEWGYIYAGIDKDSEPGTIVPGDESTYEDDTDSAPPISWEQPNTDPSMREFRGKVFLDKTTGELKSGQIREGDGKYNDNEPGIKGVKVKLVEKDVGLEYYTGEGKYKDKDGNKFDNYKKITDGTIASGIIEENSVTDENGEYVIKGYVPGNYVIQYTWGGQKVTVSYDGVPDKTETLEVKNYKGTIYDHTRYTINDQYWYKGKGTANNKVELRYSDAIDDYETRKNIDQELKEIQYSKERNYAINEMTSTSLDMNIEVEYDTADEYTDGKSYLYNIHNVDFGIVERARQRVEIKKRISHLRVILANGEVVSDVDVKEDGSMTGENKHVTFMDTKEEIKLDKIDPTHKPTLYELGFIKVELDNEILQGAKIEVTYRFTFYNHSEVDINNDSYYKFGTTAPLNRGDYPLEKEDKDTGRKVQSGEVIKISPSVIVDYLDKNWGYEESKNEKYEWKAITQEEYKALKDIVNRPINIKEDIFGETSDINNRIILYTEYLANSAVMPNSQKTVDLKVSKELTTSDDISLNNETEILELDKWDHKDPDNPDNPDEKANPPGIKGSELPTMPGDKIPGAEPKESDESQAPIVIVTPSTGENYGYVIPIVIGIVAFAILGVGIIFIKKVVLK